MYLQLSPNSAIPVYTESLVVLFSGRKPTQVHTDVVCLADFR